MGYVLKPQLSASASGAIDVPDEVAKDLEEMYAHLRSHPEQEGFGEFDSADERLIFTKQARAWATTRQSGVLTFRVLPSKNLPATQLRFSLKADLPANGTAKTTAGATAGNVQTQ